MADVSEDLSDESTEIERGIYRGPKINKTASIKPLCNRVKIKLVQKNTENGARKVRSLFIGNESVKEDEEGFICRRIKRLDYRSLNTVELSVDGIEVPIEKDSKVSCVYLYSYRSEPKRPFLICVRIKKCESCNENKNETDEDIKLGGDSDIKEVQYLYRWYNLTDYESLRWTVNSRLHNVTTNNEMVKRELERILTELSEVDMDVSEYILEKGYLESNGNRLNINDEINVNGYKTYKYEIIKGRGSGFCNIRLVAKEGLIREVKIKFVTEILGYSLISDPLNIFIICFKEENKNKSKYHWYILSVNNHWIKDQYLLSVLKPNDYEKIKREFDDYVVLTSFLEIDIGTGTLKTPKIKNYKKYNEIEFEIKNVEHLENYTKTEYGFENKCYNIIRVIKDGVIQEGFSPIFNVVKIYVYNMKGINIAICIKSKDNKDNNKYSWYQLCDVKNSMWRPEIKSMKGINPSLIENEIMQNKLEYINRGLFKCKIDVSESNLNSIIQDKKAYVTDDGTLFEVQKGKYKGFNKYTIKEKYKKPFRPILYNEGVMEQGINEEIDCISIHIFYSKNYYNEPLLICFETGVPSSISGQDMNSFWFYRSFGNKLQRYWDNEPALIDFKPEKSRGLHNKIIQARLKSIQGHLKEIISK